MEKLILKLEQLNKSNLDLENRKEEDQLIINTIKHPYNNSLQDRYDQFYNKIKIYCIIIYGDIYYGLPQKE